MRSILWYAAMAALVLGCESEKRWVHVAREERVEKARTVAIEKLGAGGTANIVRAADVNDRLFPADRWQRVDDPRKLGWSLDRLEQAKEFFDAQAFSAAMIVQDGAVVASWGDTTKPYNLRSIRKAFVGALYGRQVASGAIRLDATLAELGIDDSKQPLTAAEKQARVSDILSASSGLTLPASYDAGDKPKRGSVQRGTFVYNNWDFNVAGTIYERAAKRSVFDAFTAEIAQPVGMKDLTAEHMTYRTSRVSDHPAYLFTMSARDLARFGLLYLRGGEWNGKQLVPRAWIEESTSFKVTTPRRNESYGYLWWVRSKDAEWGRGAYSSTGNGGQLLWIDPEKKLVVVLVSDTTVLWLKRAVHADVTNAQRSEMMRKILAASPGGLQ